jgi:hypothetical protein
MSRPIVQGATDQSTVIRIVDATTGAPETGVVAATAGLALYYRREGGTRPAQSALSDVAAVDSAHTDGGLKHIGDGYYRVDPQDAAFASGAHGVLIEGTATDMVVIGAYHPLVAVNPYDAVRGGMTALPNAAAEAAGGLYTRGTGAGQIEQPANGQVNVNVHRWLTGTPNALQSGRVDSYLGAVAAGVMAAASFAAGAFDAVWSVTTRVLTAGTNIVLAKGVGVTGFTDLDAAGVRSAVGLASANLDTQLSALSTAAALASAQADVTTLLARLSAARAGYLDNLSGGAVALASAVAAAASDITTLLGRLTATRAGLLDNLDTTISSRLAAAGYTAPPSAAAIRAEIDAASTQLAAILAKVTALPSDPADASIIAEATVAILSDTGNLLARLTSARALLIDRISDLTELDGAVYRFTVNALEQGPAGGGGGGGMTTDTALPGSPTAGTVGEALAAALHVARGKKTMVQVSGQWKLRVHRYDDANTVWKEFDVDHPVAPSSVVPA